LILPAALDRLGFGDYRADAEAVLKDCKAVAAKRRRQSTRLENLGIPEEELLRQQQELFAKVYCQIVSHTSCCTIIRMTLYCLNYRLFACDVQNIITDRLHGAESFLSI
jgi:hypothetical protein